MNQESKIIISKAISDVGYWQWWGEASQNKFHCHWFF